jgi:hypothetical protein
MTFRREMTETRTLQFENARAVQSLYAHDLKLIKNSKNRSA